MEVIKLHELWVLFFCFGAGALSGFVFDIFRSIRKCFSVSDRTVAVHDMLFWLITGIIVYLAIYISNSAELRWFELIGLMSGAIVYILCLSRFSLIFLCKLTGIICKMFTLMLLPFRAAYRLISLIISPVVCAFYILKSCVLYNLHKVFLKTSQKTGAWGKNICKKFFFTFLKR